MSKLQISNSYIAIDVEYEGEPFQARWSGGSYVNYFYNDQEFSCAWQSDEVKDIDTLEAFVKDNMPFHITNGEDNGDDDDE